MRNMANVLSELENLEIEITEAREKLEQLYYRQRNLREELQDGCPHPIEYRERHVLKGDDPGTRDSVWYTCRICNHRFDEED